MSYQLPAKYIRYLLLCLAIGSLIFIIGETNGGEIGESPEEATVDSCQPPASTDNVQGLSPRERSYRYYD